jgi:two-component system chemotaxis response regulator CheB
VPRGKRGGLAPFGRKGQSQEGAWLTDLGCPDCRGVLAVVELPGGQLSFACRVGHTFSGESLTVAKEDELETSLWTAVESLEEIVLLHLELAGRFRQAGAPVFASEYGRRARLAKQHITGLRRLIARDKPALGPDGRS